MFHRFLHLYTAISVVITISNSIKNKHEFIFLENEIEFLKHYDDVLKIFMKPTMILQNEQYCSISFVWSYIYQVSKKLQQKCQNNDIVNCLFYHYDLFY